VPTANSGDGDAALPVTHAQRAHARRNALLACCARDARVARNIARLFRCARQQRHRQKKK